jgi:NADH:ubiquinone oxidoreductase subunit B-like Fe-S oxidoreductase
MDLRKKFLTDNLFRKKLSTSCCIVELHSEKDKNFLMDKYGKGKYGLLKSLQIKFKKLFCPE